MNLDCLLLPSKGAAGKILNSLLPCQFACSPQLPCELQNLCRLQRGPCRLLQLLLVGSTDLGVAQLAAHAGWGRQEPPAEPLHPRAIPLCECEGVFLRGMATALEDQQPTTSCSKPQQGEFDNTPSCCAEAAAYMRGSSCASRY
jgi:hypothetical protein